MVLTEHREGGREMMVDFAGDKLQITDIRTGIDKASVVTVIEHFMAVVKDSLAHGKNVYLRVFC